MAESVSMKIIGHIQTDFETKFGIPRQSGLVNSLKAAVIPEPEYRVAEAFRGLEGYSHLWLLWQFSEALREDWSPTVRPPRLGGNTRMGVFASRSPYRPNAIGLSSVKLEKIDYSAKEGPVLWVSGADLMNGTPIFDIKPYLAYTDAHPEATGGFALQETKGALAVSFLQELPSDFPSEKRAGLLEALAQDPRPGYHDDPERIYGMEFAGFELRFRVAEKQLTVLEVFRQNS